MVESGFLNHLHVSLDGGDIFLYRTRVSRSMEMQGGVQMQIRLEFSGSDISLPLAYQHQLQGLVYHALQNREDYRTFLHDSGFADGNRRFKLFTFGRLNGSYRIQGKQIIFPQGFQWELRSADPEFISVISAAFLPGSRHTLCGNELTVVNSALSDIHIPIERIQIRLLSPVTAYQTSTDGHTRYYSPEEEMFYRLIEDNARRKWNAAIGTPSPGPISLTASGAYRKVVTVYKGIYITAWLGRFTLSGQPALLELLYNTGLGAKNAQGFGMFEVLSGNE